MLSLGQAAKLTGLGKTTLTRAIRAGRLSAQRNLDGSYAIDPAELSRVYPFNATPETGPAMGDVVHHAIPGPVAPEPPRDPELAVRVAALEAEIAGLKALLDVERQRTDEIRAERDRWASQAETAHRLLTDQRAKPGLLAWLFRKAG